MKGYHALAQHAELGSISFACYCTFLKKILIT